MVCQESAQRAVQVGLGKRPADVVFRGGRVVDVHLARVRDNMALGLAKEMIAYVGPEQGSLYAPNTIIRDLGGAFLIPGLIDGHTHLDSIFTARAFADKAVRFGNTTCISETSMIAGALGAKGVDVFCDSCQGLPLRVFFLSPSLTPPMPDLETSAKFDDHDFERFISRPDVVGLGETYWPLVLEHDPRTRVRIPRALALGKTVEGHGAGAHGHKLGAYAAAGVESCHEAVNIEEVRARLDLGMAVQIREGYIRREMEAIVPHLTSEEQACHLLQLVSDVSDPGELLETGGLNLLLKKGVELGLAPLRAIQMMTLNPALHFNLRLLGSLTPGKLADMVVVEDLESFECREVWVNGRQVSQGRKLLVQSEPFRFPDWTRHSFGLGPLEPDTLILRSDSPRVKARVITLVDETITTPEEMELETRDGWVCADPEKDLILAAHLDRRGKSKPSLGLVKGTGIRAGAVAMSLIWDTCNVMTLGLNEQEMAFAANRLLEMGGGLVAVKEGRVLAEMPMPVGGVASIESLDKVVGLYSTVEEVVQGLGCRIRRPFLTLQILPFTGLPFIRLTDKGLVDVKKGRLVAPLEPVSI